VLLHFNLFEFQAVGCQVQLLPFQRNRCLKWARWNPRGDLLAENTISDGISHAVSIQGTDLWSEEVTKPPAQSNRSICIRIWESLEPTAGTFKLQYTHTHYQGYYARRQHFSLLQTMHVQPDNCPSDSQVVFAKETNEAELTTFKVTVKVSSLDIIRCSFFKSTHFKNCKVSETSSVSVFR
jgi:hypothetical protein